MGTPATAIGLGAIAAVAVPWVAERNQQDLGGLLAGVPVRLPIGGGFELHWSWLAFCVVTLIAWASLAVARSK